MNKGLLTPHRLCLSNLHEELLPVLSAQYPCCVFYITDMHLQALLRIPSLLLSQLLYVGLA